MRHAHTYSASLMIIGVSITRRVQRKPTFLQSKNNEKNQAEDGCLSPVRFYRSDANAFRESGEISNRLNDLAQTSPRSHPNFVHAGRSPN